MRKLRIPPPLGLSGKPNLVQSAEREAEILAEFHRRLNYLLTSFKFALSPGSFNLSLDKLEATIRRGARLKGRGKRVHPSLEVPINFHALKFATERTGREDAEIEQSDVERAAAHVSTTLQAVRGRPRAAVLEAHVGALMALIQETTGLPVWSRKEQGSGDYGPQLAEGGSKLLLLLRSVDPTITETQIGTKVRELRRKYAGRAMRFCEFLPGYGVSIRADGFPTDTPHLKIEAVKWCAPIYCR
jgi:hypothetical protein